MNIKATAAACALAAAAIPAAAQGLHESIGVDGKYVREVIVQDKISTLPKRLSFSLESSPLDWWQQGVPTPFAPDMSPMPAVTPFAAADRHAGRGYLDLGLGSWLDGNLSAGYRFIQKPGTTAGAFLQFNTTSLFRPRLDRAADDVRRRLADGRIGVYAAHAFPSAGTLRAEAGYRLAGWNYYGYAALLDSPWLTGDDKAEAPTQTLNEADARVAWSSLRNRHGFSWDAALAARHFAYRALWLPEEGSSRLRGGKGDRETALSLGASIRKQWRGGSELGIALRGDMLLYSRRGSRPFGLQAPDDYGMASLNPYYRFSRGLLNIRLGATVDLAFNAGPASDRYGAFHIAPDVRLDWRKGPVGLFLNLLGGSELQTLASLHALDYYAMPALASTRPVHSPLDAAAGANFGPFAGFSAGLSVRYRISRGVPAGGWYMAMLNYGSLEMPGMTGPADRDPAATAYSACPDGLDISGVSIGLDASYRLGRTFEATAKGSWQPQDGETGYFNGYDRPRWTASLAATVRPLEKLSLSLEYEYRGVRRIYTRAARAPLSTEAPARLTVVDDTPRDLPVASLRLPDLTLLSFRAAWQFTPRIGIFAQAANILNRKDCTLPLTPMAGITALGGVNILF